MINDDVPIQIKEVGITTAKENSNFMSKYQELIKRREEKVKWYKDKDSAVQDSENKQHKSISNTTNDSIVPEFNVIQKDIKLHNTDTSPSNDISGIEFNKNVKCFPIKPKIVVSFEHVKDKYVKDYHKNNYDELNIEDTLIPVDNETHVHIDIKNKIKQNDIKKNGWNNIDNIEISSFNKKLNFNHNFSELYHSEISSKSLFTSSLKNNTDVSKFEDFNENENLNTLRYTSPKGII